MSLYRGFLTAGGLTAVSRVFGFFRDVLLAAVMGIGCVADAFLVSFRFPNLFRALFAEGAFCRSSRSGCAPRARRARAKCPAIIRKIGGYKQTLACPAGGKSYN
jgi:hypothetical protein